MLSQRNVSSDEWMLHPQMVQVIWGIFTRPEVDLCASEDNTHCQTYFSKDRDALGPRLAQPPLCFFPNRPDPTGNQGTEAQSSVSGPALEEPALVLGAGVSAHCSPLAHSPEMRPSLSGEQNDLAPPARSMGAAPLASRWESSVLPENVLNTISQAKALSKRCLYAPKWSVFSAWCITHGADQRYRTYR